MAPRFRDRTHAGSELAKALDDYRGRRDVLVLALPRGGVPVAAEVARALGAPLDVFVVRKVGVPGRSELALGAVASGGISWTNKELVSWLGLDQADLERLQRAERREVWRRERAYRGERPFPEVSGKVVVLV